MKIDNLFSDIPSCLKDEIFEEIDTTENISIERIISDGHASPDNFWYNQERNELVFLLQGSAILEYETGEKINLNPGDYIKIEAHQKHRVAETSKKEKTIWLAIHY